MDRASSKHSPRTDDQLAAEVSSLTQGAPIEAHSEEFALSEPSGEDQPRVVPLPDDRDDLDATAPPAAELEARSRIARWLPPASFPARAEELARDAAQIGAPDDVTQALRGLPAGREFAQFGEVWDALGGPGEAR